MFVVNILTLFPENFPGALGDSLIGKALKKKIWKLNVIDIRKFSLKNGKVDDNPYGGGSGMVIKPDVLDKAILSVQDQTLPMYCLSPRGKVFNQKYANKFSKKKGITLICGKYQGIDERVIEKHSLIEISIGDYILSGGDLAAMIVLDSVLRLLPNVIGNADSLLEETFNNNLLEYPLYTKPKQWENNYVPSELLSGDHKKIKNWKIKQSEVITKKRRPDLWQKYLKSK